MDLRSLDLIFNFVVFNSFDLSRLGYHFSFGLRNVLNFGYGYVLNFGNGNLFFDSLVFNSGNIFFLVFYGLVFSFGYFFRNSFNNGSFNFLIFYNILFNLFLDYFFNLFIFNFSSFNREVFNSRFSFNISKSLLLYNLLSSSSISDGLLNNLRRNHSSLGLHS